MWKSSNATKPMSLLKRNYGVIEQLEELQQRTLQWLVCSLHADELPLRHLFLIQIEQLQD